jgi:UrcA family protein
MINMRYFTNKRTVISSLLLLATALGAGAASASECETVDDARRCHVHYADLDLARSPDAAKLYARIRSAAGEVCEPLVESTSFASVARTRQCMAQAIEHAVADVNAPTLTSYHMAQSTRPIKVARQ